MIDYTSFCNGTDVKIMLQNVTAFSLFLPTLLNDIPFFELIIGGGGGYL